MFSEILEYCSAVLTLKSTARAFLKLTDHIGSSPETTRLENFLDPECNFRMVGSPAFQK